MHPRPLAATAAIIAILVVACAARPTAPAVNLSPARWPAGDLEQYSRQELAWGQDKPPATGSAGMVVGTTGALAVRSGVEALRQGGTAVDAAITTALAQITLAAGATVSFAGRMTLVHYEAASGETVYLNANWAVPEAEDGNGIAACGVPDGRQVLVHGFMAGIEEAHQRFGRLRFKSLFKPAIYFARQGVEHSPVMKAWIDFRLADITSTPEGRRLFLKPDGSRYAIGETFRQPALSRTLKKLAKNGAAYMHSRGWAGKFVRAVRGIGGRVTEADLKAYEPLWLDPVSFEFDDRTVHGPRDPGLGGAHLRGALGTIDPTELRAAGHYTSSEDALAAMLEATESRHAALRMAGSHSDGVVTVDADGNVAALLHTINTDLWGSTGLFIDGVSVADVGCWAQRGVAEVGPGGRLTTPDNPLIVSRGGVPVAASSAIGSGLYPATLFSLVNLLAYGMTPAEALATPTFDQATFNDDGVIHRVTAGDFSSALLSAVRARGFNIQETSPPANFEGSWVALTIDPETGQRRGAAGKRLNGLALPQ